MPNYRQRLRLPPAARDPQLGGPPWRAAEVKPPLPSQGRYLSRIPPSAPSMTRQSHLSANVSTLDWQRSQDILVHGGRVGALSSHQRSGASTDGSAQRNSRQFLGPA